MVGDRQSVGDAFQARAATPSGLSRFASSCPHRIAIADELPVISMWQPFASLVFEWDRDLGEFVKAHETRGFRLPARLIGQLVLIHATAKFPAAKFISEELNDLCYDRFGCGYNYSLPFGAIIGSVRFGQPIPTAELAPFQPASEIAAGDWTPGRWAWPIMEAIKFDKPIPAKGKQGWWRYPASRIETRSAETAGLSPKGESLTANGGTPNLSHQRTVTMKTDVERFYTLFAQAHEADDCHQMLEVDPRDIIALQTELRHLEIAAIPSADGLREALEGAREQLRLLMLDQPLSGERVTYNDGFASGLCYSIGKIDAALASKGGE